MMKLIDKTLMSASMQKPDGRPLHCYSFEQDQIIGLEQHLRQHLIAGQEPASIAPGFVSWAAELIRVEFKGGHLTWDFVFSHLGMRDERILGVALVERGLDWWKRKVKRSNAGNRMSLYSLMAEGGLPQALLAQKRLYRRVVMGLLTEVEAAGRRSAPYMAEQIASRKIKELPQIFQTNDFALLLADLALSLADLRAILPAGLPNLEIERWLDQYQPGWLSMLPLRMTSEIAETLICPALRGDGIPLPPVAFGSLSVRELRSDTSSCWHGFLRLKDEGWLPEQCLADSEGLRLRLLPMGSNQFKSLNYSATPGAGGWRLRRFGGQGEVIIQLPPQEPFVLAAFADGQSRGEAVIDPGLPEIVESPFLFHKVFSAQKPPFQSGFFCWKNSNIFNR